MRPFAVSTAAFYDVDCFLGFIHRMTVTQFSSTSTGMQAGFRCHLVGKALTNVCYSDIEYIGFVGTW